MYIQQVLYRIFTSWNLDVHMVTELLRSHKHLFSMGNRFYYFIHRIIQLEIFGPFTTTHD